MRKEQRVNSYSILIHFLPKKTSMFRHQVVPTWIGGLTTNVNAIAIDKSIKSMDIENIRKYDLSNSVVSTQTLPFVSNYIFKRLLVQYALFPLHQRPNCSKQEEKTLMKQGQCYVE